jgi:hypothetical protein
MAVDPTYGVNNFNKAKVLTEAETYVNNILAILFGKPGFYPSIPNLGMDIQQELYKFEDEINTDQIKAQLASQCQDFLPIIKDGTMDVLTTTYNNNTMLLFVLPVIIDKNNTALALGVTVNEKGEMVYNFTANPENTQIN